MPTPDERSPLTDPRPGDVVRIGCHAYKVEHIEPMSFGVLARCTLCKRTLTGSEGEWARTCRDHAATVVRRGDE